jgi:hypothetical protein
MENKRILFSMCCLLFVVLSISFLLHGTAAGAQDLPEELQGLQIEEGFFTSSFKEVGVIRRVTGTGKVVVLRRAKASAYYGKEGDPLFENDALYTLADCRCRLEFKDKNVVTMAPLSHLDIDEISASIQKGEKKSVFGMMKGKAIFYAIRLFSYRDMSLQLRTPTATIGVRGTKFGSEVARAGEARSRVLDRMVASRGPVLVEADPGKENIMTRAYVFEGEVEVTSLVDGRAQRLHENEILKADLRGLGDVVYDPLKTRAFMQDVMGDTESAPQPAAPSKAGGEEYYQEQIDRTDKMEDVRQRQITPPHAPESEPSHHESHPHSGESSSW